MYLCFCWIAKQQSKFNCTILHPCLLSKHLIVTLLPSVAKIVSEGGRCVSDHVFNITAFSGFKTEGLPPAIWRGGESEALDRLRKHLDKKVTG